MTVFRNRNGRLARRLLLLGRHHGGDDMRQAVHAIRENIHPISGAFGAMWALMLISMWYVG